MKEIDGDLLLEEDTTFDESIKVDGDIRCEDGKRFDLKVHGHIDAWNIDALDIDALNIDAWNIDADGKISYYARLFAYKSITAEKIESRRDPAADPIALDGDVTETGKQVCEKCGQPVTGEGDQ